KVVGLLLLDARHRVIRAEILFRGTIAGASVYPREVVRVGLESNAAAVILVHKQPLCDFDVSPPWRLLANCCLAAAEFEAPPPEQTAKVCGWNYTLCGGTQLRFRLGYGLH